FRPGPVFAHVVLADEINRAPAKVQSAMLEAMAEKQVTVDNQTHPLDPLFFVIATQNPLDLAGTYPLPTPQLDRFLFKITMDHIERDAELKVLETYPDTALARAQAAPHCSREDILGARTALRGHVRIDGAIKAALVDLARALRADEHVLQGASTRALLLTLPALQARALIHGRDHVIPEDLAELAPAIFAHRIECSAGHSSPQDIIRAHVATEVDRLAKATLRGR
ncbi:MAG: AAA family ATPase, partial [Polyangiales bacterium]